MRKLLIPVGLIFGHMRSNGPLLLFQGVNVWVDPQLLENNLGTNLVWENQVMMLKRQRFQELNDLDRGLAFKLIFQTLELVPALKSPDSEGYWVHAKFSDETEWFRLYYKETKSAIIYWCKTKEGVWFTPPEAKVFYLSQTLELLHSDGV